MSEELQHTCARMLDAIDVDGLWEVWRYPSGEWQLELLLGDEIVRVRYCPWCGVDLEREG